MGQTAWLYSWIAKVAQLLSVLINGPIFYMASDNPIKDYNIHPEKKGEIQEMARIHLQVQQVEIDS